MEPIWSKGHLISVVITTRTETVKKCEFLLTHTVIAAKAKKNKTGILLFIMMKGHYVILCRGSSVREWADLNENQYKSRQLIDLSNTKKATNQCCTF